MGSSFFTKVFYFLFAIKSATTRCNCELLNGGFSQGKKNYYLEKNIVDLPKTINESSGLLVFNDSLFLSQNDSGGKNEIYAFDKNNKITDTYIIENEVNTDWEALATDGKETIFIGDIGNNCNCRKDLSIIKYDISTRKKEGKITFRYPEQKAFPPKKKDRNFDCEAMFFYQDSLYLISKNRGNKTVHLYSLPTISGDYEALLVDKIKINSMVTDASINKTKTEFSVLTYGKILTFKIENGKINFQKPNLCFHSGRGQTEGISYGDSSIYFTNEAGKMYKMFRKNSK